MPELRPWDPSSGSRRGSEPIVQAIVSAAHALLAGLGSADPVFRRMAAKIPYIRGENGPTRPAGGQARPNRPAGAESAPTEAVWPGTARLGPYIPLRCRVRAAPPARTP